MASVSRASFEGPLAQCARGFADELARLGYSRSAAKKQLLLMSHLSRWLGRNGLGTHELTTEIAEPFFRTRRDQGRANLVTTQALKPLLNFLRHSGVPEPKPPAPTDPLERFLARYRLHLSTERRLVDGTIRFYLHVARLFVSEHMVENGLDLAHVTAMQVTDFTVRVCEGRGLSSARQAVSAMRSLFRYLRMEGVTEAALEQAALSVAGWDPALPRSIDPVHVARLLACCDRRTSIGRRDYAILMLLARLGLRGGEVIEFELGDIDWRSGEILVRGKHRRKERLPLPVEVGDALASYLRRGRPASDSRRVFLRHHAPHVGLAETGAIRGVLERACARAGVPYCSPHRMRHTAATEMLRSGAPLSEIAQVLRHRSVTTTTVYAKVDHERLRELARGWPGGAA